MSLRLIVLAVLALLAALAMRAYAGPYSNGWPDDDESDDDRSPPLAVDAEPQSRAAPRSIAPPGGDAPPVSAVIAAAYRAAGLAHDPTPGWRVRSRLAALVPWVAVRAGQNDSWREVTDPTVNHGVVFDARVAWHLDRLVFDGNEPRIAMLDVARRRERRHLATLVVHHYFDWLAARATNSGDLAETAAELDALTDGWFSEARRRATETAPALAP